MATTISNKVRFYHSKMEGAPALAGLAGSLISVLDACLVNGFGNKAVDSIAVTGGIAVAQISAGHTFTEGDVLRINGATPVRLNGDWRLASVTASSVTWSVEGCGIDDGPATGSISALRAPAGWEKVFASGTTRAAYRSLSHASHNGLFLYVDDTTETAAKAMGYETMVDIDTGGGGFPPTSQRTENWWGKSVTESPLAREWFFVADDKRFTYSPVANASFPKARQFSFGLLQHAEGRDLWATFINGGAGPAAANAYNVTAPDYGDLAYAHDPSTTYAGSFARDASGTASVAARVGFANPSRALTGGEALPSDTLNEYSPPIVGSVLLTDSNYVSRGLFPSVAASYFLYSPSTTPRGSVSGVPGNGVCLLYSGAGTTNAFFLHLGVDGRWD